MLGPQKTEGFWEELKGVIQNATQEKYIMNNYLNEAPSINFVRNFDPYRPIIPPISNFMLKPSTTYLTAF